MELVSSLKKGGLNYQKKIPTQKTKTNKATDKRGHLKGHTNLQIILH